MGHENWGWEKVANPSPVREQNEIGRCLGEVERRGRLLQGAPMREAEGERKRVVEKLRIALVTRTEGTPSSRASGGEWEESGNSPRGKLKPALRPSRRGPGEGGGKPHFYKFYAAGKVNKGGEKKEEWIQGKERRANYPGIRPRRFRHRAG